MIIPIGQWVLEQAVRQLRCWKDDPRYADIGLAVNISQKQFRQSNFVADMLRLIDEHAIDARRLDLELTETLIVQDIDDLLRKMNALVERGVRFSLDDFGTGFSSFVHLNNLPITLLKVDKSFVGGMGAEPASYRLVQAMINLGHNLHLQVVAEGVETPEQLALLRQFGCDQVQGYLISKPLPLSELARFLVFGRHQTLLAGLSS